MNKEQQRKEFKEWLDTVIYDNSDILSPQGLAWEAWQAAMAKQSEIICRKCGLREERGEKPNFDF